MRVGIFSGLELSREEMVIEVRKQPAMSGAYLSDDVSTDSTYVVPAIGEKKFTVAALDLGIKGATPRHMAERGIEVHVLPSSTTPERMLEVGVDGVFFSNGPGDPATADHPVALVQAALEARRPLFGICFGNQVLGRALGFGTYKLKYGHRGINLPVQDRTTGKVEVIAGINLPMLIRLAKARTKLGLIEATAAARDAGRNYITIASEFLGQVA